MHNGNTNTSFPGGRYLRIEPVGLLSLQYVPGSLEAYEDTETRLADI
jgi:hypothetical protein